MEVKVEIDEEALAAAIDARLIEHGLLEQPKGKKKAAKAKEEEPELDMDVLKEKCTALVEAKGKAAAVALLKKFKCAKLGELPEAKWAKFAAEVDAAATAEEGAGDGEDLFGD